MNARPERDPARIRKHSAVIAGHRTSVTLEDIFWERLMAIAARDGVSINELITRVDARRTGNLSSALRVFVVEDRGRRRD